MLRRPYGVLEFELWSVCVGHKPSPLPCLSGPFKFPLMNLRRLCPGSGSAQLSIGRVLSAPLSWTCPTPHACVHGCGWVRGNRALPSSWYWWDPAPGFVLMSRVSPMSSTQYTAGPGLFPSAQLVPFLPMWFLQVGPVAVPVPWERLSISLAPSSRFYVP